MATGKEMCELISKYLEDVENVVISPEDIWEYSPTGELVLVYLLYDVAKEYYSNPQRLDPRHPA